MNLSNWKFIQNLTLFVLLIDQFLFIVELGQIDSLLSLSENSRVPFVVLIIQFELFEFLRQLKPP